MSIATIWPGQAAARDMVGSHAWASHKRGRDLGVLRVSSFSETPPGYGRRIQPSGQDRVVIFADEHVYSFVRGV